MDRLIPIVDELQDVLNPVGLNDFIELPQIVVIGLQSVGKSSVIESIVGRDFLPRGTGVVTRTPLVLRLEKVSDDSAWAVFEHLPEKRFLDFNEVSEEIRKETNKLSGDGRGISKEPIKLKIFSREVLKNLSLIDLPGITKIAVGGQPTDIERFVRDEIVMDYIKKEKSIILVVTPATEDMENSDSVNLAKKVDPDDMSQR